MTAAVAVEVLAPKLGETGLPLLDASGEPILEFQPIEDTASLLPGDEFRYALTVTSAGSAVEALEIGLDVPPAGRLLPETATASVEASFVIGSSTDATLRAPLFVEVDGQNTPNPKWAASPETFDRLFVTIDRIAPKTSMTVTYHLVVR